MKKVFCIWVMLIWYWAAFSANALDVPYLTGRVTDNADILSDGMRSSLTRRLKAHEDRTTNQIAILTLPTLEGESIEEFAVKVFEEWKLGQKGKDNGILVLVVPNDRRMRIEVGYGLEGTLTDSMAGGIIRNTMTPRFKREDFDGGTEAGIIDIIHVLEGGKALNFEESESSRSKGSSGFQMEGPDLPIVERILLGVFIFSIIGLFTVIGVLTPGVGWFLYFFLIPFWAMFPMVIVGTTGALCLLVIYLIAFPIVKLRLKNTKWYQKAKKDLKTKGRASIGGFKFSSRSSGSSWSSGGSSFSGGGGSSGGGGASGSW